MTWTCSKLRLMARSRPGCSAVLRGARQPASPVDLTSTVPLLFRAQSSVPLQDASSSSGSTGAKWGAGRSGSWTRPLLRSSECGSIRRCAVAVSVAGCLPVSSPRRSASVACSCDWTQAATCPRRSASTVPAVTARSLLQRQLLCPSLVREVTGIGPRTGTDMSDPVTAGDSVRIGREPDIADR